MNPGNVKLNIDIKMTKEGQWGTLNKFLTHTEKPVGLKRAITYGFRDFLRAYQWAAIKGLVTEGAFVGQTWPPSSYSESHNTSTGIRTGNYLRAIENMKARVQGDTSTLKFSRSDLVRKSHKGGYTLSKYMKVFEAGSQRQVARPLWAPAFEKVGGYKRITNMTLRAIERYYSGIGVPQVKVKFQ